MAVAVYRSIDDLEGALGVEIGPGEWFTVEQGRIDRFADATEDHQWIHIDPDAAAKGPFGTTVAHGFLTLSLVPHLVAGLRTVENVRMGINYGLNKVRFPAPVPVGSRLRGRMTLVEVERLGDDAVQTTGRVTVEIEGGSKPACVADMVTRLHFARAG